MRGRLGRSPVVLELTPMLEVVDMPNNIIKKIPAGIGKAQHLRKLNLTGNDIAKVPKTVGKLKVGRNCSNFVKMEQLFLIKTAYLRRLF